MIVREGAFLDFLQGFQTQHQGCIPAFFSPVPLVVGQGGQGIGGEHDFRKFLLPEPGAGGKGAGFHVHQLAAFSFSLLHFFPRFPEKAIACPGSGGMEGEPLLFKVSFEPS